MPPLRVAAGTSIAGSKTKRFATTSLYFLITSTAVAFSKASLVSLLAKVFFFLPNEVIKSLASSLSAACSVVSNAPLTVCLLREPAIIPVAMPLAVSFAPLLRARYPAPPTPVVAVKNAVAPRSTVTGAIIDERVVTHPTLSPIMFANRALAARSL